MLQGLGEEVFARNEHDDIVKPVPEIGLVVLRGQRLHMALDADGVRLEMRIDLGRFGGIVRGGGVVRADG